VALSLKTYLPNVTIVGKNTFGKGVGQTVFENKENKYIIFLTDSFWNVKETNILEIGVQPDIIVNGTKFEDFLQPVIVN
jgi:C-terminal processing protease CtpA/Prc